jgi:hypothetical protein
VRACHRIRKRPLDIQVGARPTELLALSRYPAIAQAEKAPCDDAGTSLMHPAPAPVSIALGTFSRTFCTPKLHVPRDNAGGFFNGDQEQGQAPKQPLEVGDFSLGPVKCDCGVFGGFLHDGRSPSCGARARLTPGKAIRSVSLRIDAEPRHHEQSQAPAKGASRFQVALQLRSTLVAPPARPSACSADQRKAVAFRLDRERHARPCAEGDVTLN